MIRLALIDANETRRQAIAIQLRGVALDDSCETCDAAVFLANSPTIEQFLQAGKHVLLSLDAGTPKERWPALADIAKQAKAPFTIVNPDRYLPSRRLIRQQLGAGIFGDPGLIRLHRWSAAAAEEAILRDLDLVLWYFGKAPNLVYAAGTHAAPQIHLGFSRGGMALIAHAHGPFVAAGYSYLSVIGAHGAAYADDHQNVQLAFQAGAPRALRVAEGFGPWAVLVQEWVDGLAARDPSQIMHATESDSYPTKAWQTVLAVHDAAQQSLWTKQAVAPEREW